MSDATRLLTDLRMRGVQIGLDGDEIVCRAPRGTMTPEDLAALRTLKPAITRCLLADVESVDWRTASMLSRIPASGPIRLLVAVPNLHPATGRCFSCSGSLNPDSNYGRCPDCISAAKRALDQFTTTVLRTVP
jgi:hypothetical protein